MPSKHELQHAVRYATEQTRFFMMVQYQQRYPDLFKHATIQTRPATKQDFYIPPKLANRCLVVEKTAFQEKDCIKAGCFPFKTHGVPCEPTDPVQWTPLGNSHTLSCQSMCQASDTAVDTEWWDNECVMVNPLKKIIVMFPERVFGVTTAHKYHNGLTWEKGQVKLNANYCKAYGLEFNGYECNSSTEQSVLETLFGTTIYRSIKTAALQPVTQKIPPSLPNDLNVVIPPVTVQDITDDSADSSDLAKQIATEMSVDFGVDVGLHAVETILKKRVPKLVLKATTNVAMKTAMTQAVLKNVTTVVAKSFVQMGRAVGAASTILAPYSIASLLVDIIDPNMYNYMLTGKMVDNLNRRLDLQYFQTEANFNQPVTPEYIWDYVLVPPDESERYLYMANKIDEYLKALRPTDKVPEPPKPKYHFQKPVQTWNNWTIHAVVICMLVAVGIIFVEWVHVWSSLILVAIMYFT